MTFHPDVALQAMEDVKRRRQERVVSAAEARFPGQHALLL